MSWASCWFVDGKLLLWSSSSRKCYWMKVTHPQMSHHQEHTLWSELQGPAESHTNKEQNRWNRKKLIGVICAENFRENQTKHVYSPWSSMSKHVPRIHLLSDLISSEQKNISFVFFFSFFFFTNDTRQLLWKLLQAPLFEKHTEPSAHELEADDLSAFSEKRKQNTDTKNTIYRQNRENTSCVVFSLVHKPVDSNQTKEKQLQQPPVCGLLIIVQVCNSFWIWIYIRNNQFNDVCTIHCFL